MRCPRRRRCSGQFSCFWGSACLWERGAGSGTVLGHGRYRSLLPAPGVAVTGAIVRVEQIRGGVVEAVHDVHVAVVDSAGTLVARAGGPELGTFGRSAPKPVRGWPPTGA